MEYVSKIRFTKANERVNDEFIEAIKSRYGKALKIEWLFGIAYITIKTSNERYKELIEELKGYEIDFNENVEMQFTKKDLDNAKYLELIPKYEGSNMYEQEGMFFQEIAPKSEIYIKQISDLMIRKKDIQNKDIIKSYDEEIIISLKLMEIFEREELKGGRFRGVYTKGEIDPIAYQIVFDSMLPKINPQTKLNIEIDMPELGFRSYSLPDNELISYSSESIKNAVDFNITQEYFGIGLYPRPIRIISQRARQCLIREKIKGLDYVPILIID